MKFIITEKQLKDFSETINNILTSFFSDNEYVCNFEVSFDEEENEYIVAVVYNKERIISLNREKGNTATIMLSNKTKIEVLDLLRTHIPFKVAYFSFAKDCN